jgi:hypothetical protein
MDREERLQWTLSNERRLVTIKFSTRELDLTAEHLASFIGSLEHIWAKMQPETASLRKSKAYESGSQPTSRTAH